MLCLLLVSLVGCGGRPTTDGARAEVQRLLDARAAAVLGHDEPAYRATGTPAGFADLKAVPFSAWSYRVTAVHTSGGTASAPV